jgi:hypothetical protein
MHVGVCSDLRTETKLVERSQCCIFSRLQPWFWGSWSMLARARSQPRLIFRLTILSTLPSRLLNVFRNSHVLTCCFAIISKLQQQPAIHSFTFLLLRICGFSPGWWKVGSWYLLYIDVQPHCNVLVTVYTSWYT